jgi:hypothetical protein
MTAFNKNRIVIYTLMIIVVFALSVGSQAFAVAQVSYGDQNIEQWSSTIGANIVQAYLWFNVNQPTVIKSITMFMQYSGSDGTTCIKFGIYRDSGTGSVAGQPLVAATQNGYCLRPSASWGPAWETFNLLPSDYLVINGTGGFWLATLANQAFGQIYHYSSNYGAYDYNYGYATVFFQSNYAYGFPSTFAPASWTTNGGGLFWEGNGPYSIYVTGTTLN